VFGYGTAYCIQPLNIPIKVYAIFDSSCGGSLAALAATWV
jgi:hypothetical protein